MLSSGLALISAYSDDDDSTDESDVQTNNIETDKSVCPVKKFKTDEKLSGNISPVRLER